MRVLIVEDEIEIALSIEDVVLAEGFEVIGIARNSSEAMEMAPEAEVAIVDVRLADGLSGPEVAKSLVNGFGVAVVFLTGSPELVKNPNGIPILSKPPTPENIRNALTAVAKLRSARLSSKYRSGGTL